VVCVPTSVLVLFRPVEVKVQLPSRALFPFLAPQVKHEMLPIS